MVNILFMLGNGFDVNLKLETSFVDIPNEYIKEHENTSNETIQKFISVLSKNKNEWAYFEKELGIYTEYFDSENKHIYIEQIKSFKKTMREKLRYEENRFDTTGKEEYIVNTFFYNSIANIIQYLSDVSKNILSPYLARLQRNFDYYYNFITFNYTNTLEKCIDIVKEKAKKKALRIQNDGNGTFNIKDIFGKIIYIHGTLNTHFILGVDNENQIKNKSFIDDIRWLIKPYQNKNIGENSEEKAKELIEQSNVICVFGMAIGETDQTWWKQIYRWLKKDGTRQLIIFFFNKDLDISESQTVDKHLKLVKNLFFSVIGINKEEDKKSIINRIHIPLGNKDFFKINLFN